MLTLSVMLLLAQAPDGGAPWVQGDHVTGEWGGRRTEFASRGVTFDFIYTAEVFANVTALIASDPGATLLGHIDAALTVDVGALGLWRGGKFYVLGQNNHGQGINDVVGSATQISNLEQPPFFQLGEFFYEHSFFGDTLRIRLGKQDANREFGSPRYGGNFLNNNFGMFPTSPLPSYPTNGLGAAVIVQPTSWLSVKAVAFEGRPTVGSFGFNTAFEKDAGAMFAAGAAVTHRYGVDLRNGGVTSVGVWQQLGEFADLSGSASAQTFTSDIGVFVQNDERIYAEPSNPDNAAGLNVITRFGWAQPDRTNISLYFGASAAWHGLGFRHDDTVGAGFGWFQVNQQLGGTPGPGSELFFEAFYKWRLTAFFSLQPSLQYYLHPGGDGRDALIIGLRGKAKF